MNLPKIYQIRPNIVKKSLVRNFTSQVRGGEESRSKKTAKWPDNQWILHKPVTLQSSQMSEEWDLLIHYTKITLNISETHANTSHSPAITASPMAVHAVASLFTPSSWLRSVNDVTASVAYKICEGAFRLPARTAERGLRVFRWAA